MKRKRLRGSKTFGKGSHKKGRGGGSRGGRGECGGCKHHFQIYGDFGKHGFVPKTRVEKSVINLRELDEIARKIEGDVVRIDLRELKIDKVLGGGRVTKKIILVGGEISERAREKLEKAGCEIANG